MATRKPPPKGGPNSPSSRTNSTPTSRSGRTSNQAEINDSRRHQVQRMQIKQAHKKADMQGKKYK
jgi:hypothetical protein